MRIAIINKQNIADIEAELSLYALYRVLEANDYSPLILSSVPVGNDLALRCDTVFCDIGGQIPERFEVCIDGNSFTGFYSYVIANKFSSNELDYSFVNKHFDEIFKDSNSWVKSNIKKVGDLVALQKWEVQSTDLIDFKIQNLMFPDCEWKDEHWWMMYRGEKMEYAADEKSWLLNNKEIECFTYFNSLSVKKWDLYTNARSYNLHLQVKGKFKLRFVGRWLETTDKSSYLTIDERLDEIRELKISSIEQRSFIHRTINEAEVFTEKFKWHNFDTNGEMTSVVIPAEYNRVEIIGFEIIAILPTTIYEGYWSAKCDSSQLNEVNISLCTTTFKKEEYIIPNIRLIKQEIFNKVYENGMDELGNHFFVNVVDNGQTLLDEQINSENIRLHLNPNVGGAGGYTRGMMETIKMRESRKFDATHVLFMDDDVKILPESFKRTYALLRLLKEEYRDRFISGAMLDIKNMNEQFEDLGFASDAYGAYMPLKPRFALHKPEDILKNEQNYTLENAYAAWWYCCVPIKYVDNDNLSYPIFYRGDDIDFSLRNKAEFISLNGICVWHTAFNAKITPSLEFYLVNRNSLITQALDGIAASISYFERIKHLYKEEIRKFNYAACEHLLDAIDDYLKGPEYIASLPHDYVVKVQAAKNEKLLPVSEFGDIDLSTVYDYVPLNKYDMELFESTDNGHTLPDFMQRNTTGIVAYMLYQSPGRQFLHKQILAVDKENELAVLHKIDKARYAELNTRFETLIERWDSNGERVAAKYREVAPKWRSAGFWKEYLVRKGNYGQAF
jgi:hypothetical protein